MRNLMAPDPGNMVDGLLAGTLTHQCLVVCSERCDLGRCPGATLRFQSDQPCLGASSATHAGDRGVPSATRQNTISLV